MRKAVLLAVAMALGVAGVAYAASNTTNQYIITTFKVTPKKSGTKTKPAPIATSSSYTIGTVPKGEIPNLVTAEQITLQDARADTNAFPACSQSRLLASGQGPSSCPKGSQIGAGFFTAYIEKSGSNSPKDLLLPAPCRVDVSIFNSSNNRLSYYLYLNPANKGECPSTTPAVFPVVFNAKLNETKTGNLVQSFTIPKAVLHPITGYDARAASASVAYRSESKKVKGKTVGLFESTGCPNNHKRQLVIRFSNAGGAARVADRLANCS